MFFGPVEREAVISESHAIDSTHTDGSARVHRGHREKSHKHTTNGLEWIGRTLRNRKWLMCLWKERKKSIVACSLRYLEGTTKLKKPRTLCLELSIDAKETYVNDPCTIKKFKERLKEIQGTCVKYYTNSVPSKVRTVQVLRFVGCHCSHSLKHRKQYKNQENTRKSSCSSNIFSDDMWHWDSWCRLNSSNSSTLRTGTVPLPAMVLISPGLAAHCCSFSEIS